MSSPAPDATAPLKKWGTLATIGAAAVVLGMLLPQLLPSPPEAQPSPPAVASKAGSYTYKAPEWPEPPSQGGMFLRLGLGTIIVLGLCVGTIYLCKRWTNATPTAAKANSQLALIETLSLGRRCWVQLLHVNKHPVLIGGDASGIKTIVPMPESFSTALLESSGPQNEMATILAQRFTANLESTDRGERG